MSVRIKCTTQAEFEACIKAKNIAVLVAGAFALSVSGSDAPEIVVQGDAKLRIEARETSAPVIEAWGTSAPRIEAWGTSAPRIVAWGTSAPRIEARGTSAPVIVAWETSAPVIEAWGTSAPRIEAWGTSAPVIVARGTSAPVIEAWETSAPRIVARETSAPVIVARGTSAPVIEAWETSAPRIEARGTSAPVIVARGFAHLRISGKAIAALEPDCTAIILAGEPDVTGGICRFVDVSSPEKWCNYYGVPVIDGVAVLFKCVMPDFKSARGGNYTPGAMPVAADWDGGAEECGGGLHFSPHPTMALSYHNGDTFVACPVWIADMRAPNKHDKYPDKIKAKGCCAPVWQCDRNGEPVKEARS